MNLGALHFDVRAIPGLLRAEWAGMSVGFRAWLGLLLLGCAVGGVAALIALPPGWEVMGTSPSVEWGLLIVGYAAFAITTSGLCLTSSLGTVFGIDRFRPLERRHAILAILCLVTAFGVIALELHWPIRMVFGVVLSPAPSSPMWWMGVAYGGYLVILLVEIWSMFAHRARLHQYVCTMAAIMAVIAPTTLGAVFGYLVNRPFWHGPISSLYMIASAILAGAGILAVAFTAVSRLDLRATEAARRKAIPALRLALGFALLLSALFVARIFISGMTSREPGMAEAVAAITTGPLGPTFIGGRIVVGLVLPFLLLVIPATRTDVGLMSAGILALIGVFIDRTAFIIGGLIAPTSSSTGGVVPYPYASYTPSAVEIAVIVGAVCFIALTYTFLERYLDLGYYDIHVGFSFGWLRRRRTADEATGVPAGGHA